MAEEKGNRRSPASGGPDDPTLFDPATPGAGGDGETLADFATGDEVEEISRLLAAGVGERLARQGILASGGMGDIEVVVDRALERRLAKKVLKDKYLGRPEAVSSFLREARITSQLDHPAVVPVHEVGVDGEGRLFFTMKIVEGETFDRHLDRLGRPPLLGDDLFDVLEILIKVCDALAFAHHRGVVHCDVKPPNVLVGEYGQTYLMDWGIALPLEANEEPSGPIRGTPAYMAPEQAQGRRLDERTDVFGVGALLYFALTRRTPYPSGPFHKTLELARGGHHTPISVAAAGLRIPERLQEIVRRAMAADPDQRPPSMQKLREELVRVIRGGATLPTRTVAAGEHVVREGEPGQEAYVLIRGRAEAYRIVDGQRRVLGPIDVGEVIGEMAILTSSPRTASVVATEDCTLAVLSEETLERELEGMQPWMARLLRALAERFREREERSLQQQESPRADD